MNTPQMPTPLRVLIVDDEPLARQRLRALLADCRAPEAVATAEAGDAAQAVALAQHQGFDVALLDIHMPGADGLRLAAVLRQAPKPPQVVFVTAHAEHAVQAFELEAVDYLTKPVRLERLQLALQKAQRMALVHQAQAAPLAPAAHAADVTATAWLRITERGRTERVPVAEVLYFKAEQKYITVRTAAGSHLLDDSLSQLDERYPGRFLRIHRNALVARNAIRALVRHHDPQEGEGWAVRLAGVDELLMVSRRQLAAVREALGE
ncbi:MAG: LytTR family DNA-binding domain-containing protein [Pseudomonadota bacterium]|nr:LytTR family DNA-binding domain-containing protein [Pseudomonadota bacterium]